MAALLTALPRSSSGLQASVSAPQATPAAALAAAVAAADPADRIVVCGSFYTVGGVLQDGIPRLTAPHLAAEGADAAGAAPAH